MIQKVKLESITEILHLIIHSCQKANTAHLKNPQIKEEIKWKLGNIFKRMKNDNTTYKHLQNTIEVTIRIFQKLNV